MQMTLFETYDQQQTYRTLAIGDKVNIKYYSDKIKYVQACHPQMMEVGEIVLVHGTFSKVVIADQIISVDGEKLILV